jgi:hypothetical protein
MARSIQCPKCRAFLTDDSRSHAHQGAFFAFLQSCFDSWPLEAKFTPVSADHLRQWALKECGHVAPSMTWAFANTRERNAIMPFVTQYIAHKLRQGRFIWARENDGKLELIEAASINWNSIGERKFCEITDGVFALMLKHGFDFESWKQIEKPVREVA